MESVKANYESLTVYKKALELAVYFENVVRGMDRYHKYAIGLEFRNNSQEVLMLISKANNKSVRVDRLTEAIELLEELRIRVRIGGEIKAFKQYEKTKFPTECIIELIKQCEGWRSYQNSTAKKPVGASNSK